MAAPDPEVLIAGAGPTGLLLALWLPRLGRKVRIVDRAAAPGTTSRAIAVHARTLEHYRQLGVADRIVAQGLKFSAANLARASSLAIWAATSAAIRSCSASRRTSTNGS